MILLLESNDKILLESGDFLLLELLVSGSFQPAWAIYTNIIIVGGGIK